MRHSEETKRKISLALKGKKNGLGAKRSDAFKRGVSNRLKGKRKSSEHIKHIVEARRKGAGYKMSPESIEKIKAHTKGERHWNWKGGRSNLIVRIRATGKYIAWRYSIFKRDDFTCTRCGDDVGGNLEAHHIESLTTLIVTHGIKTVEQAELCAPLWDEKNGITLCKDCHKETDSYGINMKENYEDSDD